MDEMIDLNGMQGVVTVIQARLNSSRLPGKILLPLGDATVLEHVIRRIRVGLNGPIVLALPQGESNSALHEICRQHNIPCVMGSSADVLDRVLSAARQYEAKIVVRCQASNPLLDPKMLWASARYALDSNMDLVTVARLPMGVATEAMPIQTLERIARLTQKAEYREQVTTFTSARPDLFERAHLPPPPRLSRPDLRMTLETEADYWFLKRLYEEVTPDANGLLRVEDCIAHIDTDADLRHHSPDSFAVVRAAA